MERKANNFTISLLKDHCLQNALQLDVVSEKKSFWSLLIKEKKKKKVLESMFY